MRVVVHKYGGSSVKDIQKIKAVARQVAETHKAGMRVVVVVSAMGNSTNELLELAHQASPTPSRREMDMLVSVGERISMTLLSMAINQLGVPAQSFTGSQSGIITDESHSNARIVAVRPVRVRQALQEGKVAIVAGFQGVSRDKEVTTLGRGGSDTTAVALAAALDAEWCEIHSDVPGVFSADPRAVPKAIQLESMSLDEALNMARNGAQILHDESIAFALREGIELVASSAEGTTPGTRIQVAPLPSRVTAIVADTQLECFEGDSGVGLLTALEKAKAPIRSLHDHEIVVDLRNWHDRESFKIPKGAQTLGPICQICAVGIGIGTSLTHLRLGTEALRQADIEIQSQRSLPDRLSWWISPKDSQAAQRCLHLIFIESENILGGSA
jgi:aspartate kinase